MKKKKILKAVAITLIASASGFGGLKIATPKEFVSELQRANVEALTDDEGTPVGRCNMKDPFSMPGWYYFCNSQTSESMIYPCPSSQSFSGTSGTTLCTKK